MNMVGMVVCVGGITLHVIFKILRARGSGATPLITSLLHNNTLLHSIPPPEEEKAKVTAPTEDAVKLLPSSTNHKFTHEFAQQDDSDSGDSVSLYETRRL